MIRRFLKRCFSLALLLGLLSVGTNVFAQENAQSFSIEQAVNFAYENSPVIKNSQLDVEIAKKKVWETTATGLPQVNASLAASYMLGDPPALYKQFLGDLPPDAYNKAIDKMRFGGTVDLTVSQLIFSGGYIVGLQTSKIYKSLSELSNSKSKQDLRESVISAYSVVLVAKENLAVLDSTYKTTDALNTEMQKMYEQGLIEETDADQIKITLGTIKNQRDMVERQIDIAERLLKFQIGYDIDKPIVLTDGIQSFTTAEVPSQAANTFDVENNISYQLLKTQENLQKMNMRLNQSNFLPTISAYYQHEEQLKSTSISFTPPNIVGLKISLPIFTSGQRLAQLSQAKMGYVKAQNETNRVTQGLKLEYTQDRSAFLNAIDKYNTSKLNMELSKKIYDRTIIKYRQGVSSSLELTQNQNQFLQNQGAYYNSIIELTNSKTKFEKLLLKNN